jgi:Histone-like transcription factor (CBF/NF-Y) and archaeal histone
VKNVSKEALVSITKVTELFIATLAIKSSQTAALRGGKTIKDTDIFHTIHKEDNLDFLRLDFPKRAVATKPVATKTVPKEAAQRQPITAGNSALVKAFGQGGAGAAQW